MDPSESAKAAGLRSVTDDQPGIRRLKRRDGFAYVGPDGKAVRDAGAVARIRKLAIPPAYTDVWISPDPRGHVQATGRDARGRKQYRYHPRCRDVRDETKFERMVSFAKALPAIRAAVRRDLARSGLPREKVLATVVALLASTMIRVGNEEYARANDSYGLTTMLEEHVRISGDTVRFRFRGKSGREHSGVIEEFLANGAHSLARRKHRKKAAPGSHALSADELRVLNFIETLATRDENKHLGDLLAKSVLRAARNTRARTAVAR